MPSLMFNGFIPRETDTTSDAHHKNRVRGEESSSEMHHSSTPHQLLPTNNPPPARGARGVLYAAVAVVMVVIIGIWAYAFPAHISLRGWRSTSEVQLFSTAKNQWQNAFAPTASDTTATKERLANNLEEALTIMNNQGLIPSTTPTATPTSSPSFATASSTTSTAPVTSPPNSSTSSVR